VWVHKSSTHNISVCRAKQSLTQLKDSVLDAYLDLESEPNKGNDKGKHIIDVNPNATFTTTNI